MLNIKDLSRRSMLKIMFFSSFVPSLLLTNSCKDNVSEPIKKTYKTTLDKEIAKIKNYLAKKTEDGYFNIPIEYIYPKGNRVLIVTYRDGKNLLQFKKVQIISRNQKRFKLSGLENKSLLLKNPSGVINMLNKIDHKTLKLRFFEKLKFKKS